MTRRGDHGLTLMELMVVVTIMALVLGMSTAFLSKLNRGYRFTSAANKAATVIRASRNFSLSSRSLSSVEIREVAGEWRIAALGQRQIGLWHLENSKPQKSGGYLLTGGNAVVEGKVGGAALLLAGTALTLGPTRKLPPGVGVAMAAWFYPEGGGTSRQTLFDYGGSLVVTSEGDGSVHASINGKVVKTPTEVMIPLKWSHVEVVYDQRTLTIAVDGVFMGEVGATSELVRSDKAFTVGGKRSSFVGRVDEVRLSNIIRPEQISLPVGVVVADGPGTIRFDRQGLLDPIRHSQPIVLWLYSKRQSEWRKISVSRMGRVRITEPEVGPLPKKRTKKKKKEDPVPPVKTSG